MMLEILWQLSPISHQTSTNDIEMLTVVLLEQLHMDLKCSLDSYQNGQI